MVFKKHLASMMFGCAAALGGFAAAVTVPTSAFAQENEGGGQRRRSQTLDPAVARVLQEAFTLITEERYQEALPVVNRLIAERGERMKPYDKSTTYEIRGQIKINLEDFRGGQRDFQTALDTNGLPPERNNQLRYFIAQIHVQLEQYGQAIAGLNAWIRDARAAGVPVDPNAYYLLAASYVQNQPPNYRAAMGPAENVLAARGNENKKGDYDLLNLIYSELSENTKRAALLERIINIFPGEETYWNQLAGLYSTTGRDRDAFAVLEVAYRAGLVSRESSILTLVNYYSFFENPYRGAKLLEREMSASRVKRNLNNLILLSQLWSQAREHKRAIPVLREAANLSDRGELSYRLGQVLLADEQYVAAERALVTALNKGGMSSRQTGDAWLLLGTARFNQAGPGDRSTRNRARTAFNNATRYTTSAGQARNWVAYIKAIEDTEKAQDELERQQRIEDTQENIERIRTQAQVCRLQGGGDTCNTFLQQIEELEAELQELENAGDDDDGDDASGDGGGEGGDAGDGGDE